VTRLMRCSMLRWCQEFALEVEVVEEDREERKEGR
jgi:hypothetical protein